MISRRHTGRRTTYHRWFGRTSVWLAWAAIAVALLHPPQETSLKVCWVAATIDIPCPGCGLTRALSSAARGLFEQSWHFHPFGVPLLLLFVLIATVSVMPSTWQRRIATGMNRHHRPANLAYVSFIGAFILYGLARAIAHLLR